MQKWEKMAVLLKLEGAYAVDASPTGGANAMLARNVTFDPNPSTVLERRLVKPTLGNVQRPIAARHATISMDFEATGSGTVDVPPAYFAALRACGLAETITPTTGPVEYDPVSSGEESCSIYWHMDGSLHKMLGVRGSVSFVVEPNDVPLFRFAFTGLHVDPSAVALPTADFSAFQMPSSVGKDATPTFTLHGYAGVLRSLTLDLAQRVVYRDLVGAENVEIVDREPTGEITIESPALGTQDFFAVERAGTLAALQVIHGTAAGGIVQVDCPKIQILNPRYADVDGIAYLTMTLNVAENAGDDEIKFTVK